MFKNKFFIFLLCFYVYNINTLNVLVHGTLFPGLSHLVRMFDIPLGMNAAHALNKSYVHGRMVHLLSQNSSIFSIDSFYTFGWSGKLSFNARKLAALDLYRELKSLKLSLKDPNESINLICHSHGGNVALLLTEIVQEYQDNEFFIDRLILLATPVQKATENYVSNVIFKKVYLFYSEGDLTQVLDPQGLYYSSKSEEKQIPLFSKRIFNPTPNLKQARVLVDDYDPKHIDFIWKDILIKSLDKMIQLLDREDHKIISMINISEDGTPELILS